VDLLERHGPLPNPQLCTEDKDVWAYLAEECCRPLNSLRFEKVLQCCCCKRLSLLGADDSDFMLRKQLPLLRPLDQPYLSQPFLLSSVHAKRRLHVCCS
jgi:hypothetical protein